MARVRRTLAERVLVRRGERVLVACSGGPDSGVLLHVLHRLAPELGVELCAASVDHGLRPDAGRDVEHAAELARTLGVGFTALRVTVPQAGASIQGKARSARYEALLAEAERQGATAVAVGHTLDDQAETVLARLLRGSGVLGLSGIDPRRADGVIRPLLDCRRARVHAYARRHELPFVCDPSNENEAFTRARLRATVLPALEVEEPRVLEHLARLADDARDVRALARASAGDLLARAERGPRALALAPLLAAPATVRTEALARWVETLVGAPARRAHLVSMDRAVHGKGEALLPGGIRVCASDERLIARDAPDEPVRGRRRPRGSE